VEVVDDGAPFSERQFCHCVELRAARCSCLDGLHRTDTVLLAAGRLASCLAHHGVNRLTAQKPARKATTDGLDGHVKPAGPIVIDGATLKPLWVSQGLRYAQQRSDDETSQAHT
jgi:hypothetical protein